MREATGELNMSVIVISLVAILVAFFYTVIWPVINEGQKSQLNCSKAVCGTTADENGMVECHLKEKPSDTFTCKFKG